jgi:peptide/nickel transport system substrate-binding protein
MVNKNLKLKWRRVLRKRTRQAGEISSNTDQNIEKHFVKRLARLPKVRRFLFGWICLLVLLSVGVVLQSRALEPKYQTLQPKSGGLYTEGIVGSFNNANPLYTSSTVDSSVSKLVFSGLLKHNSDNKLVGDLAEKWSIDQSERIYTVKLRDNLRWHDGRPLTSKDVVYTYRLIQNPETKSYLNSGWSNVKIEATDDWTVIFTLPGSLSSFPYSLTNGIVPEHVLGSVNPAQLRSSNFNNVAPVGSGPFKFTKVEVIGTGTDQKQERIALDAFDSYHLGRPELDKFTIYTFPNEDMLKQAYYGEQVKAMVGLASMPDDLKDDDENEEIGIPLTGEVMVFFKSSQVVLQDQAVRKALVLSTDKKAVLNRLSYPVASIDEPILRSHIGYDKSFRQVTGKPEEAKQILDAAGWVVDPATGMRTKAGQKLSFKLFSQAKDEYSAVAGELQNQWRKIGVDMQVELQSDEELQTTLALHSYDALLYGIAIGSDPDVYAYWHSSQSDPRARLKLNFSEYKSTVADQALDGGRTRSDPQVRSAKYKPFLEAWRNDAPALALYQPRFLYVVRQPLNGFEMANINSAADRFADVENWTVRQDFQ